MTNHCLEEEGRKKKNKHLHVQENSRIHSLVLGTTANEPVFSHWNQGSMPCSFLKSAAEIKTISQHALFILASSKETQPQGQWGDS